MEKGVDYLKSQIEKIKKLSSDIDVTCFEKLISELGEEIIQNVFRETEFQSRLSSIMNAEYEDIKDDSMPDITYDVSFVSTPMYRGIPLNSDSNEFIYGEFYFKDNKPYIQKNSEAYEIDLNTLGVNIGRKDTRGNPLYSGDVVSGSFDTHWGDVKNVRHFAGYIVWNREKKEFLLKDLDCDSYLDFEEFDFKFECTIFDKQKFEEVKKRVILSSYKEHALEKLFMERK